MRYLYLLALGALALAGCGSSSSGSGSSSSSSQAALNHVHSLIVMPGQPNVVLMGTHYHLYRTTNGGRSWKPLSPMMMTSMIMDSNNHSLLYAVTKQEGLARSADGGKHWTKIATSLPEGAVAGITGDPTAHVLIAYGNGAFRSTDGGAHWSRVIARQSFTNSGETQPSGCGSAGCTHFFLGGGNGLYVSSDGGQHWTLSHFLGRQPIVQVAAAQSTVYAVTGLGLARSTNLGKTWKYMKKAPFGIEFVGISPQNPDEVMAEVAGSGFRVSDDGGVTWKKATGIRDSDFSASVIRVAPSAPQVAYTGAWGLHVYRTTNGGKRWTQVATLVR